MKKSINTRQLISLLSFSLLVMIGGISCDRDRNNPGWDFFPDMFYSNAYETNTPNPVFKNGQTQQTPVEGTIPRDMIPFQYPNTGEGMVLAGKELTNPFQPSDETIARGKVVYNSFCLHCHGEKGDGKGYLFTSGKYIYPPASLTSKKLVEKPDGEIFHTITLGYGIMGAHGSQIRPDDRWKVVLYIRNQLQTSTSLNK